MTIMVKIKTCRYILSYIWNTIIGRENGHYKTAQNVNMVYKNKEALKTITFETVKHRVLAVLMTT